MTKLTNEELRFRKKPVVIEAVRFSDMANAPQEFKEAICTSGYRSCDYDQNGHIHTLDGVMAISAGDWIIKGVKGEFYPCKPEIFALTYERMAEGAAGSASPLIASFESGQCSPQKCDETREMEHAGGGEINMPDAHEHIAPKRNDGHLICDICEGLFVNGEWVPPHQVNQLPEVDPNEPQPPSPPREAAEKFRIIVSRIFSHIVVKGGDNNPFRSIREGWFVDLAAPKLEELLAAAPAEGTKEK